MVSVLLMEPGGDWFVKGVGDYDLEGEAEDEMSWLDWIQAAVSFQAARGGGTCMIYYPAE